MAKKILTEEEKKAVSIKNMFSHKDKSRGLVKKVIIIFVCTYAIFFTSTLYIHTPKLLYTPTFNEDIAVNNTQKIKLIRWEYCKEQSVMEIELDITATEFEEGHYEYIAEGEDGSQLKCNTIIESSSHYIVQIEGVSKEKNQNIAFTFAFVRGKKDYDKVVLTNNTKDVSMVPDLTVKSEKDYRIQRANLDVTNLKNDISSMTAKIEKYRNENITITARNEELEASKMYKTTDEVLIINEGILNNTKKSLINEASAQKLESTIVEYNQKISQYQVIIDELQIQ